MFLKNYTSDVPVTQTIARIEHVLIRCGVSGITKEYGPSANVLAVRFHIQVAQGEMTVRLPADSDRALDALWLDYVGEDTVSTDGSRVVWIGGRSRKRKQKNDFAEQAERTAWKIIQDWVEVQMSMIQMKQAETAEVFMPYIWDGKQTVYARIKSQGYRALLPESSNHDAR